MINKDFIKYSVLAILGAVQGADTDITGLSVAQCSEFLGMQQHEVQRAADAMDQDRWIDMRGTKMFLRVEGKDAIHEASKNPTIAIGASLEKWKTEALTGITEAGKRSEIEWAALPVVKRAAPSTRDGAGDSLSEVLIRLSRLWGKPQTWVVEQLKTGLGLADEKTCIMYCRKCNEWGIFGKRSRSGWRDACQSCEAMRQAVRDRVGRDD